MTRKNTTRKAKLRVPRHAVSRRKTTKASAARKAPAHQPPVVPPAMTLVACPMCGVSVFRAGLKGHLIYACPMRGSDAANAALMALDTPVAARPANGNGHKARSKRSRAASKA